jgi:hypothetical protein
MKNAPDVAAIKMRSRIAESLDLTSRLVLGGYLTLVFN